MHYVSFIGTCIGLPAAKLEEFDDNCREIKYTTFKRWLGTEEINELNSHVSVPLSKDWSVRFYRGKYDGKNAICLMHSGIHHLWEIIVRKKD